MDDQEPAKVTKKPAKKPTKKSAKKQPQKYSVVTCPVRPEIEVVEGKEELLELLRQKASMLGVPEDMIAECGLFSVFKGEGVDIQCRETEIEVRS